MPAAMNTQSIEVPPNNKLSPTDIAFVTLNYPFFKADLKGHVAAGWDIEHAMDVAGVQGDSRVRILEEYGQGDWRELRAVFTQHTINARLTRNKT